MIARRTVASGNFQQTPVMRKPTVVRDIKMHRAAQPTAAVGIREAALATNLAQDNSITNYEEIKQKSKPDA
jgi:hypothetical protein